MSYSHLDHQMMALAIQLAHRGRFTTRPNPNVGCVILDSDNNLAGQGWHQRAGGPHAEVFALQQAANKAKGGTAYVTLEPCSHYGRTPPCAEALIKAGVSRVVAAMVDPNPDVAGRGLAMLADAGIETSSGLLDDEAEKLNPGFLKRMRSGLPFVTLKLACSLDGKIALANGNSQWITAPQARQDVQQYRAQSCAILSGSGTVMADNPSLNVRFAELANFPLLEDELIQPLRVVVDSQNQLQAGLKMFDLPGDTLVLNQQTNQQLPNHVQQWQAPERGAKLDLKACLGYLAQQQVNHVWVEAGSGLAGALLENSLVDELILYQSPQLLGDKSQDLVTMQTLTELNQAIQLAHCSVTKVGRDLKQVFAVVRN